MGSLVMTQVAPPLGPPPPHPMMVSGEDHQVEGADPVSRASRDRSSSHGDTGRATPPSGIPATPQSPALPPRHAQPAGHDPSGARPPSSHPASTTAHQSHHPNQHSRGYDQSGFPLSEPRGLASSSPSSPRLQPTYRSTRSLGGSEATSPSRIKVKNLSHIQSFASEDLLSRPRITRPGSGWADPQRQYEISSMPVTDIIEMVAGLLTKITTTNDQQHEHVHRPIHPPDNQGDMNPQASCVLAFHGKNVPSISILSYLSRIHKYCPTTYEVFLSLLVYFDRMTDHVNRDFLRDLNRRGNQSKDMTAEDGPKSPMPMSIDPPDPEHLPGPGDQTEEDKKEQDLSQFFVVDSYNIHRLVIAGVTCASKFFSDVFYTNSRYAKVGGLPLVELNHLELQFLLLNDFRLSVPVEELEAYGTMLVEFYAREIVAQQQAQQQVTGGTVAGTPGSSGLYMRDSRQQQTVSP